MARRRNVADVIGGGLQRPAAQFRPLFQLLQSQKAESEADNFARGIKLLELDMRAKASTRASRQLDISERNVVVSEANLALRQTAAEAPPAPPSVGDVRGRVAAGTATPEDIANLQQLRSIDTAKPVKGAEVGDVGETIPDLAAFDKRGAALEKEKASFESKQALLPDEVYNRKAGGFIPNPAKTAPWPGQLQTPADSLEALHRSSVKHNVPPEVIAENWDINDAWSDLFQRAKRAAPVGGGAGIPQFPVSRGTAGGALSRTISPQGGQAIDLSTLSIEELRRLRQEALKRQ